MINTIESVGIKVFDFYSLIIISVYVFILLANSHIDLWK